MSILTASGQPPIARDPGLPVGVSFKALDGRLRREELEAGQIGILWGCSGPPGPIAIQPKGEPYVAANKTEQVNNFSIFPELAPRMRQLR